MAHSRISIGVVPAPDTVDADADADEYIARYMTQIGADFVVLPIVSPHVDEQAMRRTVERGYFAPEELVVRSATNAYCTVGSMARVEWADNSSDGPAGRLVGMAMEYAGYVGLRGVVAPTIDGCDPNRAIEYARVLLEQMSDTGNAPVISRVRIGKDTAEAWGWWNTVRQACNHDSRLQLMLDMDVSPSDAVEVGQWRAEPVQIVQIPTTMFTTNKAGYPVLTRAHQRAVLEWMDLGVALAVGYTSYDASAVVEMAGSCVKYLRHLAAQREAQKGAAELASAEYYDVLQTPLQPLADHLDSETYEVFEQDAAKYDAYEGAMCRAIRDASSGSGSGGRRLVLTVAGAGRGPLVGRALQAARRCDAEVKVYAVEKNPSAMVELQRKNAALWGGCVALIHADMRCAAVPEHADILVSELLGSLGDNELSPECLSAAIPLLLAPSGVCIPRKYTAYAAPLSSTALFNRVRSSTHGEPARLETPFVVNIHAAKVLANAQPLWSFEHTAVRQQGHLRGSAEMKKGQRSTRRTFDICAPSLVHGLAGYFDAELYGGVELSIHPDTHTPAMHSWFPMFFPFKHPLTVRAGDSLAVHMWRRVSDAKVWYEWAVCVEGGGGDVSAVHNLNGHQHWIDK
ncbi:hypothetical protein IW140_003272 [Coemansia sp. RSA 1813]|nr:hypothetical protein EV178_002891 [Coemansia sp. RSA 1646]KAJ1771681.1 hypothetical protein LPJ74_002108 [Coemansia sp. RSA 1843]KAJ2089682.1 hypothetical protein IW138_003280 [Coemansia sp. RSA 986]KAJ2214122.1 hypothetical protein EV179_003261 [Coemansia sp. RSA 487]KAJ2569180.1 hypothetical protein IW140_003272 [Coemansia sp. RSA 1813]